MKKWTIVRVAFLGLLLFTANTAELTNQAEVTPGPGPFGIVELG
jgi:hypothetical protein